jgi:4-diphosphocytidyl-2-C-methyl-D-erythritol kinase
MPAPPNVELACPSKVNLALSIGATRDDGLHPLASWMVAVQFADHLRLERAESRSAFDITFADDAPVPAKVDWPLEKDLAFRAHRLVEQRVGQPLPIHATLRKRIPAGAGLGGGSSDAAAMLAGVNTLYGLGLDRAALVELARRLGSDVAFLIGALQGEPSAIVSGVGETLEAAPLNELIHLVLIFPPFGCPTGAVYGAFDRLHPAASIAHPAGDLERVRTLAATLPVPQDAPFNDLAEPACTVRPELGEFQRKLTSELQIPVHITGSGSTLFVIAPSALTAKVLARKVTATGDLPAIATRTL